jgi:sporulation protein YqfC
MRRQGKMINKMIATADLDAEIEHRLPIIEVAGNNRVLIENHRSVTSYSTDKICVSVKFGCVRICGSGLTIAKMSNEQLVILGDIHCIALSGRSEL